MYVYFATQSTTPHGERLIKIGHTGNLSKRVNLLKYGAYHNPYSGKWRLVGYCVVDTLDSEQEIQQLFKDKQSGKDETFLLTKEDIRERLSKTKYVFISTEKNEVSENKR